jgi:hypothetical protein
MTTTDAITTLTDLINAELEKLNALAGNDGTTYYALHLDAVDLSAVLTALAAEPTLLADFQDALPSLDGLDALRSRLVRLAREIGEADESVEYMEVSQDVDVAAGRGRRIGHGLQMVKRNVWLLRRCPPFGALAERVNAGADGPVVDGWTLAGLAHVLATDIGLLGTLGVLVKQLREAA